MTDAGAAPDLARLWRSGAEALRGGANASALQAFRAIAASGGADAAVWTGIALASRNLGDTAQHLDALDQILARDPRNIRALIMKGDRFAASSDLKAADSFYVAVIKLADAAPQDVPPDLVTEVARVRAASRRYSEQYEQHLRQYLEARGLGRPGTERNATAIDLMLGKKQIFLQEPRAYYFPGLPQIEFYNPADFPWFDRVEAAWTDIRGELLEVLKDDGAFTPYLEGERDRPTFDELGLLGDPSWGAFYLWKNGERVAENAARCPKTLAALEDVPLCRIPGRTPSVLFSALRPGVRIPPHHGFMNTRLICHLPLIVPEGCGLRVGNDSRMVEAGKGWLFDDSIEHEAWNNSSELRVILLFEIWRPELTLVEREMVSATLEAIEQFGGEPLVIDS
jgi:aspartyl/asparaginyl beta-hydroxylase (cupin superfamily)